MLGPVIGHCFAGCEVGWILLAVVSRLFVDVIVLGLSRLAAGAEYDSRHQLVVRRVCLDTPRDPLIPVSRVLFGRGLVLEMARGIAGDLAELCGPAGDVGWTREQFFDFCGSLIR